MFKLFYRIRNNEKGQTMVEFALILPLLLFLLLGIIQFGIILNGQITVTSAAREGARVAVVGEGDDVVETRVRNALAGSLMVDAVSAVIEIIRPAQSGDELTVRVQSSVPIIVPMIPPLNTIFPGGIFELNAISVMRVEKLPAPS